MDPLLVANWVGVILSSLGSSSIILLYLRFRCRHTRQERSKIKWIVLVGLLGCSDFGSCTGYLLTPFVGFDKPMFPCYLQSFMISFFDMASMLWVTCITFQLHWSVVLKRNTEGLLKWYHAFVWGVAAFFMFLPLVDGLDTYGFDGDWCWLSLTAAGHWRFTVWYGPLWVVWLLVVFMYIRIRLELKRTLLSQNASLFWKLGLYPAIFVIIWGGATVNRVTGFISPPSPLWLKMIHVTLTRSGGFFNAIVFGCIHFGVRCRCCSAGDDEDIAGRRSSGKAFNMSVSSNNPALGVSGSSSSSTSFSNSGRQLIGHVRLSRTSGGATWKSPPLGASDASAAADQA